MIHVDRIEPGPDVLTNDGAAEQDAAEKALAKHQATVKKAKAAGTDPPKKFSFEFKQYKHADVKALLVDMFHGKCAYCESFYSSTQPMDVEHFRPKGAVAGEADHPGYYWLAATWTNLLPSCIDCNRKRTQEDVEVGKTMSLGKKDRFPVKGTRAFDKDDALTDEAALLVDPCIDDPADLFRYDAAHGVVLPRFKSGARRERALESIEIYGLNRSGLVADRLHVLRMIDHHLEVIRLLVTLRDQLDPPLRDIVVEVIGLELQAMFALQDEARPYCGMARQILEELAPDLEPPEPD